MAGLFRPYVPGKSRSRSRSPRRRPAPTAVKVKNAYEAASQCSWLKVWSPGSLGPNNSILNDLNCLRKRSRDATRNNAWVGKGINSLVRTRSGTGDRPPKPRAQ
jgi:hypothetical protein